MGRGDGQEQLQAAANVRPHLLSVAEDGVQAAAEELVRFSEHGRLNVQMKGSQYWADFVTDADVAAEEIIISHIKKAFPNDHIVAEESGDTQGHGERTWVIDPIDGTTNFIRGLPGFSVSVACRDQQGALLGVVADPVRSETFVAHRGTSAVLLNGKQIQPQWADDLKKGLISGHIGKDPRPGSPRKLHVIDKTQDFGQRDLGSAALTLAYTAAGRIDVTYFECPLKEWDVAAGMLLCKESGLQTDFLQPHPDGVHPRLICGPQQLCQQLQQAID